MFNVIFMLRKKRTKNYNIKISIAGMVNRINSSINRADFLCLGDVFLVLKSCGFRLKVYPWRTEIVQGNRHDDAIRSRGAGCTTFYQGTVR